MQPPELAVLAVLTAAAPPSPPPVNADATRQPKFQPGCAAPLCAGQRWRCLQYLVRRARLNLALLEQLDLVGRTGELARTFGIDFFSVLSRGSQYRVESMMVRLAHTQNYLMASPSKEQVSSALGCVAAGSR